MRYLIIILLFASCTKQVVEPIPEPECYECTLVYYERHASDNYVYGWTSTYENCYGADTSDVTEFLHDNLTGKYLKRVRTCELIK